MFHMFGRSDEKQASPPPPGVSEIVICVFDDKQHLRHHFKSIRTDHDVEDHFLLLNEPGKAFDSCILSEAVATRQAASVTFSYGAGRRKHLYVFPYERKRGQWRYVCMQIAEEVPDPDAATTAWASALADKRAGFVLVDADGVIQSAGPDVAEPFGYTSNILTGMHLSDLFNDADVRVLASRASNTNTPVRNCVFHCLDGSNRDVEIQKYALSDHCILLGIFDVTRPPLNEEISPGITRERRRIGQDLHDSIGQLLTGISLLSRSLANNLKRDGSPGDADAAQISELADEASNQIRQISRGLMPADIIQRGFFSSLRELARITSDSCSVSCAVQLDETVAFGDGAVETHLYRIAQEAVNNAVRHADATRIDIMVSRDSGAPSLKVCDDGTWKKPADSMSGIGLKSMKYRASVIGGQLNIDTGSEGGTHVVCRLTSDRLFETKA